MNMVFNIIEFSNYEVTKGGIVYNRYHRRVKRRWFSNHIYVQIKDANKNSRKVRVDKLVYQTYVQNPPYNYDLEHIDGNDANCKLENLKYISPKQKGVNKYESNNQEPTHDETLEDRVTHKLSQHNITLTQNEKDVLPISLVKKACQLKAHDWKVFKQELQTCGVKEKRAAAGRYLTNLKLRKED